MPGWPPITEPALLERLAMDDEQFIAFLREASHAVAPRPFDSSVSRWSLDYPWERPTHSYVLRDRAVQLLDDLQQAERASLVTELTDDRYPLLAIGGNGAPSWLKRKFAHLTEDAERDVLVLTGVLHDLDIGPAAAVSLNGYMAATIFASRGTSVRVSVIWVTPLQLTQLTWTEASYRLVRLDDARLLIDEPGIEAEPTYAYLHRLGSFCIDGSPVALAALRAKNRTARALSQRELLDFAARMAIGPNAEAEDLVQAIYEDTASVIERLSETVSIASRQLQASWTPFPTSGAT